MIYYRFLDVITKLAACNGTFDAEVQKLVDNGSVKKRDVPLIVLHAKMQRLSNKLDAMTDAIINMVD